MAYDYFLKLTAAKQGWIKGESTDGAHKEWIEIESFSWGAIAPRDVATGQATGRRQYQPFRFVAGDESMAQSMSALAENENLTEALVAVRKPNASSDYLTFKFTNASIGSWDLGAGGEEPMLEYGIYFQRVDVMQGSKSFTDDWSSPTA